MFFYYYVNLQFEITTNYNCITTIKLNQYNTQTKLQCNEYMCITMTKIKLLKSNDWTGN